MRSILIVDPDPIFYAMAAEYFGEERARTVWAQESDGALELLREHGISILILAISGDGKKSLNLIHRCRSDLALRNLPIVATVNGPNRRKIMMALEAGATAFAVKPMNWQVLECQIEYAAMHCHQVAALQSSSTPSNKVA